MTADRGVRRIGNRYRLLKQLGSGGMGVVWAATDELLGRPVAVKEVIPPPGLTAEQAQALRLRSMREARAAARITSRSAVNVYDVVEDDGRPWIVMELLDARPLSDVIATDGPLPPARVADIAGQLLDALTSAHGGGVLHRDVKPSNVMIAEDGRVVLTDFGIAALDGDPSLTTTGMLIGSPAYIAPERARGEDASPASDLWSLGCTIYVALEGRPPFDRNGSMATLSAVISEEPLPAPSAGPLAPVLEGLLRKDPRQRLTAAETDHLLRTSVVAVTTPMPGGAGPAGPPPAGGRTSVLPVMPAAGPAAAASATAAPVEPSIFPSAPAKPSVRPSAPAFAPVEPSARIPAPPRVPAPARPGRPQQRPRRRGSAALIAALVAAVLGVGGLVIAGILMTNGEGDGGSPQATQAQPSVSVSDPDASASASDPDASASASDPAGSSPTSEPVETSAEPTGSEEGSLPEGFQLYEDETGFSLAVPENWEVTKEGPRTDFTEPGTGRFLRVDQTTTPQPGAEADWESQEATVSQRLTGYELIRIDQVDYRDYDSADWEFTWDPEEGPALHVLNRNLITAPDQAYALYWNTPEDQWQDSLPVFETFADTFQPAP